MAWTQRHLLTRLGGTWLQTDVLCSCPQDVLSCPCMADSPCVVDGPERGLGLASCHPLARREPRTWRPPRRGGRHVLQEANSSSSSTAWREGDSEGPDVPASYGAALVGLAAGSRVLGAGPGSRLLWRAPLFGARHGATGLAPHGPYGTNAGPRQPRDGILTDSRTATTREEG
jgi:hypothetical protein